MNSSAVKWLKKIDENKNLINKIQKQKKYENKQMYLYWS